MLGSTPRNAPESAMLAEALRSHRSEIARRLFESVGAWPKYASLRDAAHDDLDGLLRRDFFAFVDLLALYFQTGDDAYRHLYLGEKLKQLYDPSLSPDEERANRERQTAADRQAFLEVLAGAVTATDLARLDTLLVDVRQLVLARCDTTLDVLFVGDCLFVDLLGFLASQALEDGIALRPTFVTAKAPAELRRQLKGLADTRFDLVFYSPLSYDFAAGYTDLHRLRQAVARRSTVARVVDETFAEIERTLDVLNGLFEAPIHVHNSLNLRRHDGSFDGYLKDWATTRTRRAAHGLANARLAALLNERRAAGARLVDVDEVALAWGSGKSDAALAKRYYNSDSHQHPAVFGPVVASHYRDVLLAHVRLRGKKLIACDLDNTIWQGEIGEGTVVHWHDRQQLLRDLKERGILLAINSKNDPAKVHWNGATLGSDDFVSHQINWEPKSQNLRRIERELNLKHKDFVFLDDRTDQRALVLEALPAVTALDATDPRTWRLLARWANALTDRPEVDRTLQYRDRAHRDEFLATEEDPAEAYARLGLRVTIRRAKSSDLPRVVELVNRTNQFNLAGSRTSLREARSFLEVAGRWIAVAEAADRFGAMGLVGACWVDATETEVVVPVFVLSCRVFGYHIEGALLNVVKRLARAEAKPIRGLYVETTHNQPCRELYPTAGFVRDGRDWRIADPTPDADPEWLAVVDETAPARPKVTTALSSVS